MRRIFRVKIVSNQLLDYNEALISILTVQL